MASLLPRPVFSALTERDHPLGTSLINAVVTTHTHAVADIGDKRGSDVL